MPFKEKVGLSWKNCFDFSLFIGVRGMRLLTLNLLKHRVY